MLRDEPLDVVGDLQHLVAGFGLKEERDDGEVSHGLEDSSQRGADHPRQVDVGGGDEVEFVAELTAVENAGAHEEAVDDEPEVGETAGKELCEGKDLGFLGWSEFDEEMVFAFAWAMDDQRCLEAVLYDVQGLFERGVGGGGPGLLALAVFDGAAGERLGFHENVEHAQFPFG